MTAPPAMIATCEKGVVQARATIVAASATARRDQSGASAPAMPQTAWATTATAASLRPWTQPASARSAEAVSRPIAVSAMADGRVNPSHAASPPSMPARRVPMANPSWLLAGPGSAWQRATRSANAVSSSHWRRITYSRRK